MEQLYQSNPRLRYVLVFKNFGPAAGARIAHTHSQFIAMPVVPENVAGRGREQPALLREAPSLHLLHPDRRGADLRGHAVRPRLRRDPAQDQRRPVRDRARQEVHRHQTLRQPLRVGGAHPAAGPPERFSRHHPGRSRRPGARPAPHHGAPGRGDRRRPVQLLPALGAARRHEADCGASYHWHLEICPRTSIPTGFELGSGLFVNTISPEAAAERLRDAPIDA